MRTRGFDSGPPRRARWVAKVWALKLKYYCSACWDARQCREAVARRLDLPGHAREAAKEYLLAYDAVRESESPDATLLDFLQTTYEAAANLAAWDRASLERRGDPTRAV